MLVMVSIDMARDGLGWKAHLHDEAWRYDDNLNLMTDIGRG